MYQLESILLENVVLCKSLPKRITGVEMLFTFLNFFLDENKIPSDNYADIFTNGAMAMSGIINGMIQRKQYCQTWYSGHCVIHNM